jgi:hypothetical protein
LREVIHPEEAIEGIEVSLANSSVPEDGRTRIGVRYIDCVLIWAFDLPAQPVLKITPEIARKMTAGSVVFI